MRGPLGALGLTLLALGFAACHGVDARGATYACSTDADCADGFRCVNQVCSQSGASTSGSSGSSGSTGSAGTSGSSGSIGSSGSNGTTGFTNVYYLSPNGSDQGAGTQSDPWKTFAYALPLLGPGDALFLLDGTYTGANSGYLIADCSTSANNGLPGQPVTVRALDERKAFLLDDGTTESPIVIEGCTDWAIEGLHAEYGDVATSVSGAGAVVLIDESSGITLRRMLIARPDRRTAPPTSAGVYVNASQNVHVEESEIYDFFSDGLSAYRSSGMFFRRNYLNSRGAADLPGTDGSSDTAQGDTGIILADTPHSIVENNVVENVGTGIFVITDSDSSFVGAADDNLLAGNVTRGCTYGFIVDSYCGNGNPPCVGQQPRNNRLVDDVAYRSTQEGFSTFESTGLEFENLSAIGNGSDGFRFEAADLGLQTDLFGENDLAAANGGDGFSTDGTFSWRLDGLDSVQNQGDEYNGPDAGPDAGFLDARSVADELGSCVVYVPGNSILRDAGVGGAPIGADVVFRYVDGGLTGEKLWDQTTGQFPCGAVIAGVNDVDGGSCADVNRRLNVGASGCAIP